MSERPLLLFPEPQIADKTKGHPFPPGKIFKPTAQRQFKRLEPVFTELKKAFDSKSINLQKSTIGINPEYALVFEVIGSVDNFYKAVKKVDGLEWMFDHVTNDIEPDEDFYKKNDLGEKDDHCLNGRVYCVMTNQVAMKQLISMWKKFSAGEENVFPRGTTPLRDVFQLLKTIRVWGAQDRIYETNALEYWKENLEFDGEKPVPFEVELFCRNEERKRDLAVEEVKNAITSMGGKILQICYIEDILYHSLLVNLPKKEIEHLVKNYENISLVNIDGIMFFRPTCQSFFHNEDSNNLYECEKEIKETNNSLDPIIAIFDGMPMQNHGLLKGRLVIDDPDEYETQYQVKDRKHGTSMASFVIHGDLNNNCPSLHRQIYFRPILKPYEQLDGSIEMVPDDVLIVDLIHRSVKRMIDGDGNESGVAPTVRIVNFSIGDSCRQFATTMSPLSRLLDWLSYKYGILFIISAGNQSRFEDVFTETFTNFKALTIEERTNKVFETLSDNKGYLKVLSPAESINNLTIGATYSDFCDLDENQRQAFAVQKGFPSPISGFGFGYNNIITPDLFFFGGRKFLREDIVKQKTKWVNNVNEPGCKSAAPYLDGTSDGCSFTFGTSDATAQLTHEAGICYEVLYDIFVNENDIEMPPSHIATLIKGMLTHGASWDNVGEKLSCCVSESQKKLSRWLGNGIPNIQKVQEGAKNRVTLIGLGELSPDEAHVFRLPLPFNFSKSKISRKLTVTLSYLAPTNPSKQKYRSTQLWFEIEDLEKLKLVRCNSDWQNVRKGTLQHEIFFGESAVVWDENNVLLIKINCKDDAEKLKEKVNYSLFVTFETAEALGLEVYEKIANKINTTVKVQNKV
ncbi:S8 family peptidase [Acetobacterium wieringae]|uniref:S8 family peptidase n=1 Tax=Acetobacterium wieringae TaxID=52694 RepID=UPI0026EC3E49|nr:S8 family peptidase [Acetobacterium wieringae]